MDNSTPLDTDNLDAPIIDIPVDALKVELNAAIDDLDDEDRIPKMLRVGAVIDAAKKTLRHGTLTDWYKTGVKRSESWCSQYWRLYNDKDYLREAIDWADRTSHKLSGCYGIDHLLKLVADYKRIVLGTNPPAPRTPWAPKPDTAKARPEEMVARLLKIAAEAEADLAGLRLEVETAPSPDGGDARAALVALIARAEDRLRDFAACTGMQVSAA
jgi:hypothetical protein